MLAVYDFAYQCFCLEVVYTYYALLLSELDLPFVIHRLRKLCHQLFYFLCSLSQSCSLSSRSSLPTSNDNVFPNLLVLGVDTLICAESLLSNVHHQTDAQADEEQEDAGEYDNNDDEDDP